MYKDRSVIPHALQNEVLDALHSGHQGVTAMRLIATESIFWPGMLEAIARKRSMCKSCDKVSPSQPAAPPYPLPMPEYPFQMVRSVRRTFSSWSTGTADGYPSIELGKMEH